jgi:hypothetical protein
MVFVPAVKLERTRLRLGVGFALGLVFVSGCGDDFVSATSVSGTDSGASETGNTETGNAETGNADAGDGDGDPGDGDGDGDPGDGDGDGDGDTGGPAGVSTGTWVNAGENAAISPSYRLRFTFGQSSTNQNTMTSRNYKLRGGLIPAIE